jgi:hypothetical protein
LLDLNHPMTRAFAAALRFCGIRAGGLPILR